MRDRSSGRRIGLSLRWSSMPWLPTPCLPKLWLPTLWLLVVVGVMAFGAAPAAATTNEADRFATVELEVVDAVPWEPGLPVGAEVSVETERAISGTLTVDSTGEGQARTSYEFDVDLAAGSIAVFPLDLFTGWNGAAGTATLTLNGEVVASDETRAFGEGGDQVEQVAFYGIDSPPQRVPELGGEEQLRTLVLDQRLRGLNRSSTLVIAPGAVNELGQDSEEWLLIEAWVRGGGQLVVAGSDRSLPAEFHANPTANQNRFEFGAGSVLYSEDWEDGIPLGGYIGSSGLRELVQSQDLGIGAAGELAVLAGLSLPSARTVAIVLLVYSVIAGPVVFGVLTARRQQRRMWLAIPAVSGLFVVGILGFGFAARSGTSDTHITIVEVNERGSRATSNLLLSSSVGGSRTVETPATWTYLGQGRSRSQRPVKIRSGSTTTEILMDAPPGSSSIARVTGVAPQFDGMLRIGNIRYQDGQITAEITNAGEANLNNLIAMVGNAREPIEDLGAGETATFTIEADDQTRRSMRELLTWPRVRNQWVGDGLPVAVPVERDAETAAGAWTEWRTTQGTAALPGGIVGVVGWTDDLPSPIAGADAGRTALFVRENVPQDVREAIGYSTVARLPSRNTEPRFDGNFQGYVEAYRVTLSEGFDTQQLAVSVSRDSAGLGFLTPDGWRHPVLPDDGEVAVNIPNDAIIDGEITIRSFVVPWNNNQGLSLAVSNEDGQTLPLVADPQYRNIEGEFFEDDFDPGFGRLRDLEPGVVTVIDTTVADGTDAPPAGETLQFGGFVARGTHDVYVVTLVQNQGLVVTMSSPQGDSYLELVDPNGELVAFNDDYGRQVDSQIQFDAGEAGDYEIRAQGLGGEGMDYQLDVEIEVIEADVAGEVEVVDE